MTEESPSADPTEESLSDTRPHPQLDPQRYYDEYGHEEWDRLEATLGGKLEFEGTVASLERFLPTSSSASASSCSPSSVRVLDVGGGAGRYSVWLAAKGYDVTLVDLSERQCEIAREKVEEHEVTEHVHVQRGDLRSLPISSDAFDAVLCTGGPLSHVVDDEERATALSELRRVATPDAPVFVSVMSRLAVLQNLVHEPEFYLTLSHICESGSYTRELAAEHFDDPEFVECHFFRAAELEAALERAGFTVDAVVGLEGIAANVGERIALEDVDEAEIEAVTETVRRLRTDPAVADWSNHILAVGRA